MSDSPDSSWDKFFKIVGNIGAVLGLGAPMLWLILLYKSGPGWLQGFSVALALCGWIMVAAWKVSATSESPFETIGDWRKGYASTTLSHPSPDKLPAVGESPTILPEDWLRTIQKTHDLVELKPNLVHSTGDVMKAHGGEHTVIVQGEKDGAPNFNVLTLRYHNSPTVRSKGRIAAVEAAYGELTYTFFDQSYPQTIHHGVWLSEQDNKIDIGITSKRNLTVALVDEDSEIYAVEREFEGAHPQGVTRRVFKLSAGLVKVRARLLKASDGSTVDSYEMMLNIIREPELKLELTSLLLWKYSHLREFELEGYGFLQRTHDILMEFADKRIAAGYFSNPDAMAAIREEEKQREREVANDVEGWQDKVATFLETYIDERAKATFLRGPSLENGLERKYRIQFLPPLKPGETRTEQPKYNWTLHDVISERVEALDRLIESVR